MKNPATAEKTIISAIKECDSHIQRLRRGKGLLDKFFPMNTDALKNASEERIEHIDQFIYRFTRLQDSMGTKLLPTLYYWLENHTIIY